MSNPRPSSWKWWICGLLLFASAINYIDRQTLANAAVRITTQFQLNQQDYGRLEWFFGWAFAVGSLLFGIAVDRFSVRWLYPLAVLLWSLMGFCTGLVESYGGLLFCRTLLGLFEGGHWPCAIKTTQWLLEAKDRPMGNSVLQSGTSIGAIITPLAMRWMLTDQVDSWRMPFQVVGCVGLVWIVFWFAMVRATDLATPVRSTSASGEVGIWRLIFQRRMLVLFAGALTIWLIRRGMTVERSRNLVFGACALLAALTVLVPFLPKGVPLLGVLLLVGAGALGVFPIYHALTQEISPHHQGKVTGVASVAAWAFAPPMQEVFGRLIDKTGSFDLGLAVAGGLPLVALAVLYLFWSKAAEPKPIGT